MTGTDWLVLGLTLLCIVLFGVYKSRQNTNIDSYFLAGRALPWYQVGLSVMATQASAITFISGPGQAYGDGMRFLQFYLGLPLAVIILCTSFIPNFHRLKVVTAYEYLEKRFDAKSRVLTVVLFLFLRSLSTAISIYAPSIILSTLLHLPTALTTCLIGLLVISYTVSGGAKAVASTQFIQMLVIFFGMGLAGYEVFHLLPHGTGFAEAMHISGTLGKLNMMDFHFDLHNRYTVWSGLIGGLFLQLSYFGTDQSQVGRYLTGSSIAESRLGLILNGFVKIPMQFLILLLGTLVFVFFQWKQPPAFFNQQELMHVMSGPLKPAFQQLEKERTTLFQLKKIKIDAYITALRGKDTRLTAVAAAGLQTAQGRFDANKVLLRRLILKNHPGSRLTDISDSNYMFLNFVLEYLPHGTIGMIIAIVFLASMGSVASACNSMASCSVVDIYQRWILPEASESHYLWISRGFTVFWGAICVVFALFAGKFGNLLEAVNSLGSLFYGTILGIFLVAFYLKKIAGSAVFYAALTSEVLIIIASYYNWMEYLWLNVFGVVLVVVFSFFFQKTIFKNSIALTEIQ